MGKARTKSSPKSRSRASSTSPSTPKADIDIATNANAKANTNDSNNYYESFPIISSTSHSRSRSKSRSSHSSRSSFSRNRSATRNSEEPQTVGTAGPDVLPPLSPLPPSLQSKIGTIEAKDSLDDPGNPLGNAIDFCVNNIHTLHTKTSTDMDYLMQSCQNTNFEQFLEDFFLCNIIIGKINSNFNGSVEEGGSKTAGKEEGTDGNNDGNCPEDSLARSSSKKGKHKWKKTLIIMPGKKFLRSMSFKRRKSSPNANVTTNANDNASDNANAEADANTNKNDNTKDVDANDDNDNNSEQSLLWRGILDVHTTFSGDSDEDTLFTNLEYDDADTWNTAATPSTLPELNQANAEGLSTASDANKKRNFGDKGAHGSSENDDDNAIFHLFFSPPSFCALSPILAEENTVIDADTTSEKGDLVIPRDFENESKRGTVRESKRGGTSALSKVTPTTSATASRSPKICIIPSASASGTVDSNKHKHDLKNDSGNKNSINYQNNEEAKIEFEMILDESRFGSRKWGKITPWKALESFLVSGSSSSSRSSRSSSIRRPSSSSKSNPSARNSDSTHNAKANAEGESFLDRGESNQRDENKEESTELELVLDDLSLTRNIIEPRFSPQDTKLVSQRSARILRKRRLQSALAGFSSPRSSRKKASSISKQKRSSWKKMLVVSVPSARQSNPSSRSSSQTKYNSKSNSTHASKIVARRNEIALGTTVSGQARPAAAVAAVAVAAVALTVNEDKSVESADPPSCSDDSNRLQYSESDEEATLVDSNNPTAETSNSNESDAIKVKDLSSTSVMGLHQWSWGVFKMDPREEDYDDTDADANHSKTLDEDGIPDPLFGVNEDRDLEGDNSIDNDSTRLDDCDTSFMDTDGTDGEEDSYFDDSTNHSAWIMDEDQLVSFEDDSTYYTYHENEDEDDTVDSKLVEREFQAATGGRSPNPEKSAKTSEKAIHQPATSRRKGLLSAQKAALSKSIRKSFAAKKKKNDVSSDVGACAIEATDFYGAATIEAVLIDTNAKTNTRRDPSTSRRGSLANSGAAFSKAKKFWKQQAKPPSPAATAVGTATGKRRWNTRNPVHHSPSKDIITVVSKPIRVRSTTAGTGADDGATTIRTKTSNDYMDRYSTLSNKDGKDNRECDESASDSSHSPSWARDDEDTQSEDFRYGYEFNPSHDVIRE